MQIQTYVKKLLDDSGSHTAVIVLLSMYPPNAQALCESSDPAIMAESEGIAQAAADAVINTVMDKVGTNYG